MTAARPSQPTSVLQTVAWALHPALLGIMPAVACWLVLCRQPHGCLTVCTLVGTSSWEHHAGQARGRLPSAISPIAVPMHSMAAVTCIQHPALTASVDSPAAAQLLTLLLQLLWLWKRQLCQAYQKVALCVLPLSPICIGMATHQGLLCLQDSGSVRRARPTLHQRRAAVPTAVGREPGAGTVPTAAGCPVTTNLSCTWQRGSFNR